jgi:hypothetical protein
LSAGLTNDEINARYPGELARRSADKYLWRFPGGEATPMPMFEPALRSRDWSGTHRAVR